MDAIRSRTLTVTFATASIITSALAFASARPPNPPRSIRERIDKDTVANRPSLALLHVVRHAVPAIYLWQSVAALCGNDVGTERCALHPRLASSAKMNPSLFTWNAWSACTFSLAILSATLRLQSFAELGKDFTFELQRPAKLKTSGIYKYIQHPSYTGVIVQFFVTVPWFLRPDGILAALLPASAQETLSTYGLSILALSYVAIIWVMFLRIKDEESMLREHFGKKWERWHARTARLVPFVV